MNNEPTMAKTESMKKTRAILQTMSISNWSRMDPSTRLSAIEACMRNMADTLYNHAILLETYKLAIRSEQERADRLSKKLARQKKHYRRKLIIAASGRSGRSSKPEIQ